MRDPRLRDGGQAPPSNSLGTRRADVPHPKGRALFVANGVARRVGGSHPGATPTRMAAKIAAVKRVNIKDGWYKAVMKPRRVK